jgi:hypothetical protein
VSPGQGNLAGFSKSLFQIATRIKKLPAFAALAAVPAIRKFAQSNPQPNTEKFGQEMGEAKAFCCARVIAVKIENVENLYQDGRHANPDNKRQGLRRIVQQGHGRITRRDGGASSFRA